MSIGAGISLVISSTLLMARRELTQVNFVTELDKRTGWLNIHYTQHSASKDSPGVKAIGVFTLEFVVQMAVYVQEHRSVVVLLYPS